MFAAILGTESLVISAQSEQCFHWVSDYMLVGEIAKIQAPWRGAQLHKLSSYKVQLSA